MPRTNIEQTIEILNWAKFNKERSDVKHSSWFRFEHSVAFDPEWDHFSAEERWVWVWLLSLASFKNRSTIYVTTQMIADRTRVPVETIASALQKLTEMGCIQVTLRTRNGHVTDTVRTRNGHGPRSVRVRIPTDGRTDETDKTDGQGESEREKNSALTAPSGGGGGSLPELAQVWNEQANEKLPKVREMQARSKRRAACEARWLSKPDRDYWTEVIKRINSSKFCLGANERGWRADIDFLCRLDTAEKVLEGKYDDRPTGRTPPGKQRPIGGFQREGENMDFILDQVMNETSEVSDGAIDY